MRHVCIGPTCAASAFSEQVRSSPNCSRDKRIHALRLRAMNGPALAEAERQMGTSVGVGLTTLELNRPEADLKPDY